MVGKKLESGVAWGWRCAFMRGDCYFGSAEWAIATGTGMGLAALEKAGLLASPRRTVARSCAWSVRRRCQARV